MPCLICTSFNEAAGTVNFVSISKFVQKLRLYRARLEIRKIQPWRAKKKSQTSSFGLYPSSISSKSESRVMFLHPTSKSLFNLLHAPVTRNPESMLNGNCG